MLPFEVVVARPSCLLGALVVASCSSPRVLPPPLGDQFDAGGGQIADSSITPSPKDGSADDLAPSPDAQGLCGNMFLDITSDAPNIFFVIDRSGSMGER